MSNLSFRIWSWNHKFLSPCLSICLCTKIQCSVADHYIILLDMKPEPDNACRPQQITCAQPSPFKGTESEDQINCLNQLLLWMESVYTPSKSFTLSLNPWGAAWPTKSFNLLRSIEVFWSESRTALPSPIYLFWSRTQYWQMERPRPSWNLSMVVDRDIIHCKLFYLSTSCSCCISKINK